MVNFYEIVVVKTGRDKGRSGFVAGASDTENLAVMMFDTLRIEMRTASDLSSTDYRVDPSSVFSDETITVVVDPDGAGRIK